MSIIDRVVRRWEDIAKDPVAVVPEWAGEDGKPLVVYADAWTVGDNEKFRKLYTDNVDWSPHVVIEKARDAEGNKLFDPVDILKLKSKGERVVMLRVANAIMFSMTLEDAKKNSPTPDPELDP